MSLETLRQCYLNTLENEPEYHDVDTTFHGVFILHRVTNDADPKHIANYLSQLYDADKIAYGQLGPAFTEPFYDPWIEPYPWLIETDMPPNEILLMLAFVEHLDGWSIVPIDPRFMSF